MTANLRSFRQSSPLREVARAAVADYQISHPLRRAIVRVRQVALGARHQLSPFRRDEDRDGFLRAACDRCGAGASIHLDTGCDSVSEALQQPCPQGVTRG